MHGICSRGIETWLNWTFTKWRHPGHETELPGTELDANYVLRRYCATSRHIGFGPWPNVTLFRVEHPSHPSQA